ncbi:hypothetical protein [Paracoccus sediminicola]|uniref:hypothetical protein n=1 Tax=Paracoccus sediminicola TaxID=3017783 RepID=UPI0022F019A2|nr:hypothetical protein [Paracoccus sediminicola]WBU58222.1 hypothetical protein PAF18_07310 [Paracoccus sediminicola]
MSDAQAARSVHSDGMATDIGDVLSSIRRLISQDDAAAMSSAAETSPLPSTPRAAVGDAGQMPQTEAARDARAAQLRALIGPHQAADAEQRLLLGGASRIDGATEASDRGTQGVAATDQPEPKPERVAMQSTKLSFDEDAYRQDLEASRHQRPSAEITTISPHHPVTDHKIAAEPENQIMLAELPRTPTETKVENAPRDDAFDLFAAEEPDHEDQLAGGNALRNLVRDVIRQELQGDMGSRISHNLRRAIRHEVAASFEAGLKTS